MNYLTRRQMMACAAVGMAAGAFVIGYDVSVRYLWSGSREIQVTIESPQPARSVRVGCDLVIQGEAAFRCRDHIAEFGHAKFFRWFEGDVHEADVAYDQSFVIRVRTSGSDSGLKLTSNSYQLEHHAVVVIELENGEQWVTVLDLPDVQQSTQATIRLPGDARRVRPTPKADR